MSCPATNETYRLSLHDALPIYKKGFAARKGVDRAALVTHVSVNNQQAEFAATTCQPVTAAEVAEVGIGMLQQLLKIVGLGAAPKRLAVSRADQLAEAIPAHVLGARLLQFGLASLLALAAPVVIVERKSGIVAGLLGLDQLGCQNLGFGVKSFALPGKLRVAFCAQ